MLSSYKYIIALALLFLALAGGGYYFYIYPPEVLKRQTQKSLDEFAQVIATKDRAKISDYLKNLLTEQSKIKLEVTFYAMMQKNSPVISQDFEKSSFISFIDNTLYSLNDYYFNASLEEFNLNIDRKSADITFSATAWGDGISYFGGTSVNSRTSADSHCQAHVVFNNKQTTLDMLDCKVELVSVPKSGEEDKLRNNPEALKELMR